MPNNVIDFREYAHKALHRASEDARMTVETEPRAGVVMLTVTVSNDTRSYSMDPSAAMVLAESLVRAADDLAR